MMESTAKMLRRELRDDDRWVNGPSGPGDYWACCDGSGKPSSATEGRQYFLTPVSVYRFQDRLMGNFQPFDSARPIKLEGDALATMPLIGPLSGAELYLARERLDAQALRSERYVQKASRRGAQCRRLLRIIRGMKCEAQKERAHAERTCRELARRCEEMRAHARDHRRARAFAARDADDGYGLLRGLVSRLERAQASSWRRMALCALGLRVWQWREVVESQDWLNLIERARASASDDAECNAGGGMA